MTMVLVFFVATFGMNFQVTTALMSRVVFHTGAGRFGIASAVFAVGALIGALAAARRSKTGMRLLIWTGLAFGLLEGVSGVMPSYWSFLILLVPTGVALISFSTLANSSVQLTVPAEMRGRVMGIYMLVFLGGTPIGSPLTGWVAEQFGTRFSLIAGAAISVAATIVVAVLVARFRGMPIRSYIRRPLLARSAA
jgi:MFS family permease